MPSKHSNAAPLLKRGLYDDLQSFAELEQRISVLGDENSKVVGDALEVFVEGYLATHQKLQAEKVWLVGQVPLDIRQRMNLPKDAKGIDGIFRTRTGVLVPYQVKFRSHRRYLTYTEIAPFLGLTERATDRIVFTNSNELADDVKNRDAMRTVRGIDFDELTADELRAISAWLREQPIVIPKLSPDPRHQIEALSHIAETLTRSDRAHVVMACGTGKTLVALWAVEQLKPKTVLVLVPSLTLLQQTLDEWSRQNNWGNDFTYICVCSDPTVVSRDEYDPIVLSKIDLEFRPDTDPAAVRRFIARQTSNIKVIFSTYHSSPIVSEGVTGLAPLDVAVFDEAHKTTGPRGGSFAHCLSEKNIAIRKRLFFTATPRHYDIRHRNREGDFEVQSMDDPTVYGPRAHTLTFGAAARQGIICNYKVVISVVDGQEVNDFVLKNGITLVQGALIGARWVANQIAIERAVEKTRAKHVITFHSRVSSAKEFSSESSRGIKQYLPEFSVFHVNGAQHSSERKQRIRDFREANKSLVTNARCLTEGVDVPEVDMVAFIDSRHSKIDIAQATGRAMRKPRGSDKTLGYIVVPLFLERESNETVEQALEGSDFSDIADVLNALQEHDEDLIVIIRELKEAKGRGKAFSPKRLAEKVEVVGPSIELSQLKANIFAEIVESIGVTWDEYFGCLKAYKEREGHCRVPQRHRENGLRLGLWVVNQRMRASDLSSDRRRRLDELDFAWDPQESVWEKGFRHLTTYKGREGHCNVPQTHQEKGFPLGSWVADQRRNGETLSKDRRQRLDDVGFVWEPHEAKWEKGFRHLKAFKEREGHCRVPRNWKENGFPLGVWVTHQRPKADTLSKERRKRLDDLGFIWNILEADWEEGFGNLKIYKDREGHCRVPTKHRENGYPLGQWVITQRSRVDTVSIQRRKGLDDLGFMWNTLDADWEEGFGYLVIYREREGHCRVPQKHKERGYSLGQWVSVQRVRANTLSNEHRQRLNDLGFVWNVLDANWEEGYGYLKTYEDREGHCRVPTNHKENGFALGRFVSFQRSQKDDLTAERRKKLDDLGFVWNKLDDAWDTGFAHLKNYRDRVGHCRVPRNHCEQGYALGQWAVNQRTRANTLSSERRRRLDELGFAWKSSNQESP
jgi:superfamily II DNA or RNA helicase